MDKEQFLKSKDFMNLGKSINSGNWQSVLMDVSRMQKEAEEAGLTDFVRNLANIRQCAVKKDTVGAKGALAVLINRRVSMMKKEEDRIWTIPSDIQ